MKRDHAALASRAAAIFAMRRSGIQYGDIGLVFGISGQRARQIFCREERMLRSRVTALESKMEGK